MPERIVRVECYAGYKGDERPVRVHFGDRTLQIVAIEDRWYSPGSAFFRVLIEGGDRYVLHREDGQALWSLNAFRAGDKWASRH
jgi:hypothetical protein